MSLVNEAFDVACNQGLLQELLWALAPYSPARQIWYILHELALLQRQEHESHSACDQGPQCDSPHETSPPSPPPPSLLEGWGVMQVKLALPPFVSKRYRTMWAMSIRLLILTTARDSSKSASLSPPQLVRLFPN